MFYDEDLNGRSLPKGFLSLTFDDGPGRTEGIGPGPRTSEISKFLRSEGIPATFFISGRHAQEYAAVLPQLVDDGHALGNHSFDHPCLPAFLRKGGDPVEQLTRTAELLEPWVLKHPIPFRAPYGSWREAGLAYSSVAACLNKSPLAATHVGPIHWDIAPADWWFWKHACSVDECLNAYLRDVEHMGRGIVLFHDSTADDEELKRRNQTFELVQRLVPLLKLKGFRFAPLHDIPEIKSLFN